jgi:hypothetical protein
MFEIRREAIVKEPHEMTDEELASTWVVRQPGPWHYYIDGAEVTKAEYWAAYLGRPA